MRELIEALKSIHFHPRIENERDLELFRIIVYPHLNSSEKRFLVTDLEQFMETGRFKLLKTFVGGITYNKTNDEIELVQIYYSKDLAYLDVTVKFASQKVNQTKWYFIELFPMLHSYSDLTKSFLLCLLGKMSKTTFESYGSPNDRYLKINSDFDILVHHDNLGIEKFSVLVPNTVQLSKRK